MSSAKPDAAFAKFGVDFCIYTGLDSIHRNKPTGKGKKMNFIELGKAAHANDELRAPAANAHVMEALAGLKVGDPKAMQIMTDFTKGYDMGVEAECAALLAAA